MGYVMDGDFVPANALAEAERRPAKTSRSSNLTCLNPNSARKLSITQAIPGPGSSPHRPSSLRIVPRVTQTKPSKTRKGKTSPMQNWKLTLTYDGTAYHGWQVQPGLTTIQGELQKAIERVLGESPLPQGSGRTDAGVHALGQVASFPLAAPIPADNLQRALNRTLPPAIRILASQAAPSTFHARHGAVAKTYEYRIFRGDLLSPFLAPYVHHCRWKMNLAELRQAAQAVVNEHDFTSLAASDPDLAIRSEEDSEGDSEPAIRSAIRTIFSSEWSEVSGDLLLYRVRGNGFLHHMVRNLVGTMLEIGRGQFPAGSMAAILEARSRSAAGPTAPARGLFLHSVEYPEESLL
jgi:tRNA pseudouridine38-40 synthase